MLLNAWQSLPIGGQAVECNLEKLISETGQVVVSGQQKSLQDSDIKLTHKQLEDIKGEMIIISLCWVFDIQAS